MLPLFSVSLALGPLEIGAITISGLGFLIMFGLASTKGDYQGLIKSTLAQDQANREKVQKNKIKY